jgi:carbamoyltransferase
MAIRSSKTIIGINEGINSSVVVMRDGVVAFALQEERVNRIKEYIGFPHGALELAMRELRLDPSEVETVCFSNLRSPMTSRKRFYDYYEISAKGVFERLCEGDWHALGRLAPSGVRDAVRRFLRKDSASRHNKTVEAELVHHGLGGARIVRTHHHLNHAAAAYFGCRENHTEPHLVFTLDGGGDDACAQVYIGKEGALKLIASTPLGHSLGNVYSRVTMLMGMTPHEHEYKVMGLAAYASREHCQPVIEVLSKIIDLDPVSPLRFKRMVDEETSHIIPRLERELRRIRFDNIAGGLQFFTEDLMLKWIRAAIALTGIRKIVAGGGVFMNVKANRLIAQLPEVEYFDVFPSCGDETLPFGAVWLEYARQSSLNGADIRFESIYLGPDGTHGLQRARQKYAAKVDFQVVDDPEQCTARLLAEGKIVARCSGRMEFGARALGNRSILADARDFGMIAKINKMIKQRDFWMPFAPAILAERAHEYVVIPKSLPKERISPWMMHSFDTTTAGELFVAGLHQYDRSTRAQVVSAQTAPEFYRLIKSYEALTGHGAVLNTSFNLHGFPIVLGAEDAIEVMLASGLDHLVIGNMLVTKRTSP